MDPRPTDKPLVEDVEAGDSLYLRPGPLDSRQGLGEQLRAVHGGVAAGGVQRGREQRARAGRLGQGHAAVDHVLVDHAALAEVEDRRLGEAAEQLVDRGQDQVRAALQGARRQKRREPQMGAPGLVDYQRQPSVVADLRQPADVGDRAEVGGGDGQRRDGIRVAVDCLGQRPRGKAVGDPELGVELGRDEGRLQPREDDPVDRARVGVALDHDAAAVVAKREAGGVIALRGAVDQKPAPPRAPGAGGEPLSPLEGGVGTDVDALDPGRDVAVERRLAQRLDCRRVRPVSALVPGDVEAAGPALGIRDDRVEIGSLVLLAVSRAWRPAPAADCRASPDIRLGL